MSEREIQKTILDYLQLQENMGKCYCFRAGSGLIKTERGGYFKTGKKGCPDILCLIRSIFVAFEVKAPKGRQSDEQKVTQKKIEKLGGVYKVAKSLEDVIEEFA